MENLKDIEDVLKADDRWESFVVCNELSGVQRPYSFKDHYDSVADLNLAPAVPERIADHFQTAKHLWIYSWYVYRFVAVAQMQAYASLEFALREKLGYVDRTKSPALAGLFREAVEKGFIKDEGFKISRNIKTGINGLIDSMVVDNYVDILAKSLPYLRNDLAHGSSTLMPDNPLSIVAESINQLFSDRKEGV